MCLVCCCCCMRADRLAKKIDAESVCPCADVFSVRLCVRKWTHYANHRSALTFNYSTLTISFDLAWPIAWINARKIIIANFVGSHPAHRYNGFYNLYKLHNTLTRSQLHACSVCCALATFVLLPLGPIFLLKWPHCENTILLFSHGLLVVTSCSERPSSTWPSRLLLLFSPAHRHLISILFE